MSLQALQPDVPIQHATSGVRAKNGIGEASGRPDKDREDTCPVRQGADPALLRSNGAGCWQTQLSGGQR